MFTKEESESNGSDVGVLVPFVDLSVKPEPQQPES